MYARQYWFEILLLFIMSLLVFINLDCRYFAADEEYNVTMGQYILHNNWLPKVWDGKNIITTINGNDFNEDLMCINLNYGAYYITALVQLLFGKNTYLIRGPFAIMGVSSSIVWYQYVKKITNINVARIFLLIYCFSIPIIIYTRNANYYAPSLLFTGLMYLSYKGGVNKNKVKTWMVFILVSVVQFHINYMLFIFTIIPILFDYTIYGKYHNKFYIAYGIIFCATAPFFIWMRYNFYLLDSQYRNIVFMDFSIGYYRFIEQIWHIFYYIAPIPIILLCYFVCKTLYRVRRSVLDNLKLKSNKNEMKLWYSLVFAILFNFIFLSFFTYEFETRYYLAIFPFMYFVISIIIHKIYKMDKVIALVLLNLLLFTNIINRIPYNILLLTNMDMNNEGIRMVITSPIPKAYIADGNQTVSSLKFESYFIKYLTSFYKPVEDEIKVLVNYLNENAKDNDTITTFGTSPWTNCIQYYTHLRLVNNLRKGYGSWANDTYYYNADKYYSLVYYPDELVDWAVYTDNISDDLLKIYNDPLKYETILIRKNLPGMRNDIWLYNFEITNEKKYVILYRRIK